MKKWLVTTKDIQFGLITKEVEAYDIYAVCNGFNFQDIISIVLIPHKT